MIEPRLEWASGERTERFVSMECRPQPPGGARSLRILSLSTLPMWVGGERVGMPSIARFLEVAARRGNHVVHIECYRGARHGEREEGTLRIKTLSVADLCDVERLQLKVLRVLGNKVLNSVVGCKLLFAGLTELRRTQYDLIYAMTPVAGIVGRVLKGWYRLPLVVRLFGVFLEPGRLTWAARLAHLEEVVTFRMRSDLLVVTDDGTQGRLLAAKLGLKSEKLLFLRNGIDDEFFAFMDPTEARKQLGLDAQEPVVLWVSRLVRWKRWDRIINSVPAVVTQIPRVKVILLGDGPDRDSIRSYLAERGLEKYVHLPGFVPLERVALYMSASNVLVSTNEHGNAGNPVLQAMAKGVPVIVAGEGDTPDPQGKAILRVPPDDSLALAHAIVKVITDHELSQLLSSRGRKIAQEIGTWEHRIEVELNAIKELSSRHRYHLRHGTDG